MGKRVRARAPAARDGFGARDGVDWVSGFATEVTQTVPAAATVRSGSRILPA